MNKKIMSGMLAASMVLTVLSGCGSKNTAGIGKKDEKVRIRMTYAAGEIDAQNKDLDVIFADFYKEHPNTEVVLEEGGASLMAKIAADDAPDIIRVSALMDIPTYANKNIIMPLDDLLAKSEYYNKDDIYPLVLNSFRYDGIDFGKGKIYGLAKDWSPDTMWVNTGLLEAEGIRIPTMEQPWTYGEYAEYSAKLSKKDGNNVEVFGNADSSAGFYNKVEKMLNLKGKSMWSYDFKKINIKNNKDAYDAIKYYFDMHKAGYQGSTLYSMDLDAPSAFNENRIAIFTSALYSHSGFSKGAKDVSKIQICPAPVADGTTKVLTTCSPTGAVISSKTKNIDEVFACWEFIHLGPLVEKRAAKGLNMPIKKSVADALVLENEFMAKNYEFARNLALEEGIVIRNNPYASVQAIQGVFTKYYDAALNDQYTFDEAIELIEKEIQILLDEGAVKA